MFLTLCTYRNTITKNYVFEHDELQTQLKSVGAITSISQAVWVHFSYCKKKLQVCGLLLVY
jgi:hypothetical protein